MYEKSCQSRFDARYWMLGAGALGPSPGDLSNLGIEPRSIHIASRFFTVLNHLGTPESSLGYAKYKTGSNEIAHSYGEVDDL